MKQWIKIRRELYEQIRKNVDNLLGNQVKSLLTYQKAYDKEFKVRWQQTSRDQLLREIDQARVIGFADFHALQQSQRAHLRIISSLSKVKPKALACEFFEARHQVFLDRFQLGKISERDLLKKIQWQKSWGFSWDHYRPLVRWAIKNKVKLIGIDQRTGVRSAKTLKERDEFSAKIVGKYLEKNPLVQILIIFGDMHWAEGHLPLHLVKWAGVKRNEIKTIFQNSEEIYFQLLEKEMELAVEVVSLRENCFCLMSVPPWVKWQNYLLYLEEHYDRELEQDGVDYADHISKFVNLISRDLGLRVKADHFSVYSAQSSAFWAEFSDGLKPQDLRWYRSLVENSVSFFIPQTNTAFLAQVSVNHAAQLAMAIVYAQVSNSNTFPSKMPEEFLQLIWLEALLYFGSKIINPKRKTDTLIDMKARLAVAIPGDHGLEALKLAISQKMSELLFISTGKLAKPAVRPRKQVSYREAARLLGGMLGERLYNAYRRKLISPFSVGQLLQKSIGQDNFREIYYELVELLESFPEPFATKKDRV